ncbi:MAG TPA: phage tail protein [Rhodanobacter sp.]|jgi:phage tail-like protein|nr:phage tail protein [Rhodanobacter sp.]
MSRNDPLLNHNFLISLIDTSSLLSVIGTIASKVLDSAVGGFSECTGIEMAMAPEEYKEGGRNGGLLKFPTRVTWSNLTLKRGLANSTELWDWHYGFAIGEGQRRDGMITLLDEQRSTRCIWYFTRGLPIKYTGPALNATQNNVAIETIEIAHEGLYQVGGLGTISGAIGAIAGLVG